jgi:hypothetical protein
MRLATVVALIVIAVAPAVAWIALRPSDITADETARILQEGSPNWRDVRCVDGDHGWDYTCGYTFPSGGREIRHTIGVEVDAKSPIRFTAP